MLPGLMSLYFGGDVQTVESEVGINNMQAWIHPALYQQFRLEVVVKGVGDMFLVYFRPFVTY